MGDHQSRHNQTWALLAAGAAGMAMPIAAGAYWWRIRAIAAAPDRKRTCSSCCCSDGSRHCGTQPEGAHHHHQHHQQQQQQQHSPLHFHPADAAAYAAASPGGLRRESGGAPMGNSISSCVGLDLALRLQLASGLGGHASAADGDCFEAAVVQALLDGEGGRWHRHASLNESKTTSAELSPRGVLSLCCSSRRSDSLNASSCDAGGLFDGSGATPTLQHRAGSRFQSLSSHDAIPAAHEGRGSRLSPLAPLSRRRLSAPASAFSALQQVPERRESPHSTTDDDMDVAVCLPAALLPAARHMSSVQPDDAQAVMQHLAGDDFWRRADAASPQLQSPHEAALRVGSWMADAGAGPAGAGLADIAAASAFLRRLSEPQRLAIVGRAHAIVTAVLQHATPTITAGTPTSKKAGTPPRLSFDPAGLPDVKPMQQQQQPQQLLQVPSLRPRDTGTLTASASDPDLYAAFTEAAADTAAPAEGAAAPESVAAAPDAASAAEPADTAKLSATPPAQVPGPSVQSAEAGCAASQAQIAPSDRSSSGGSHVADSFTTAPARASVPRPPAAHAAPMAALPPRRTSSDAAARLYSSFADGDSHLAAPVVGNRDGSFWQAAIDAGAAAAPAGPLPAVAEQDSMDLAEHSAAKAEPALPSEPDAPTSSSDYSSCSTGTAASDSGSDAAETRHSTSSDLNNSAGSLGSGAGAPVQKQGLSQGQPCSPFASLSARSPFAAATEAVGAPSAMSSAGPQAKPPLMAKNRLGSLQREDSGALPWQEAMRAQRAFAARKAAAAEADGTAAEALPAPLLHATAADPRVPRPVSPGPGSSCIPAPKAMLESGADAPTTAKPASAAFGAKSAITEDALEAACAEEELLDFTRSRSPPPAHITQRMSLDLALASTSMQRMALRFEDVKICRRPDGSLWKLGSGGFGTVYKALKNDVIPVAAKLLAADGDQDAFAQEVSILESCRDRNIVQFIGAVSDGQQTMLVTEFLELGDLFNALQKDTTGSLLWYRRSGSQVPGLGRRIALDVARGLHFLHTNRIVHMDIKTANVLLGRNYVAKISDVGMAQIQRNDNGRLTADQNPVSTFAWAAPEVLMGQKCTEKVDIYSMGVVLWELITGEVPHRGRMRPLRVPQECPQAIADVIASCLSQAPDARPTAKDIVQALQASDALTAGQGFGGSPGPGGGAPRSRRRESTPLSSAAALAVARSAHGGAPSPSRQQRRMSMDCEGFAAPPQAYELLRSLLRFAHAVHGGSQAASWAGWQAPTVSNAAAAAADPQLHSAFVMELRKCTASLDASAAGSATEQRLAALHAAWLDLVAARAAADPKFAHTLRRQRLGDHSVSSAKRTDSGNADSGASTPAYNPASATNALQRAVAAARLSPEQTRSITDERKQSLQRQQDIVAGRRRTLAELQACAEGDGFGTEIDASAALRAGVEAEGAEANDFVCSFYAVLTPMQTAQLLASAFPSQPDPAAIADFLAGMETAK